MRKAELLLLTVSAAALSNDSGGRPLTRHDKAYFAEAAQVNFVRPGLVIKITGATVGSDGLITANFTATDPKGLALDVQGVTTPGSISTSFVAAYIPKGGSNWTTLTTRPQKSPITSNTANQPAADSGGTVTAAGNAYTYKFQTRPPTGFDLSQTVRVGFTLLVT